MVGIADLLPLLIFAGIVGGVWAFLSFISRRNNRLEERLGSYLNPHQGESETGAKKSDKLEGLMDRVSGLAGALGRKKESEQARLKVRLTNAGFRSDKAVAAFLGIKFLAMIVLGIAVFVIVMPQDKVTFAKWSGMSAKLIYIVGAAATGMFLPELILSYLVAKRKEAIFLTLPDALDLMVVCVESGLGLDQAMRRVAEEMRESAPILAEEMNLVNYHLQVGKPKREALHDLGVRTGVDDVRSLVAILIQADRFGSSVAQALRVQSDSMRIRRRQLAEERAAKTAVQLIFPLVLFIFPGVFVVLVGPAAIQIQEQWLNRK